MLHSLTIQDLVIVEQLHLEFEKGMSVLSGETGAGKSVLIDAVSLCLGARADASQVREGCEKATVTAVFQSNPAAQALLIEQAIDTEDDEIHLKRVVENSGRSKAFVNGIPTPVSTLKQLAETLIDIHGQHAFHTLTKPAEQLRLIDDFGQLQESLAVVANAHTSLQRAQKALDIALTQQEEQSTRRQTLLWRMEALDKVAPQAGQWETLIAEHDRLSHGAELLEGTQLASAVLVHNEQAMLDQLANLIERLAQLAQRDGAVQAVVKNLSDGEILIREAAYELNDYVKHADLDPDSLQKTETQLSLWHDTARKLRIAPETMHLEWQQTRHELDLLEKGNDLPSLELAVQKAQDQYEQLAAVLTEKRLLACAKLSEQVTQSMQNLNMQGGSLTAQRNPAPASAQGSDHIEFLVAGHPGVSPQPIQKVASGGELARISLAITVNTVENTPTPSLIFDEVDSGIGGAVAETVGKYLRQLARNKQVLCVTHLPQVAAQGDHHYQVSKEISQTGTRSRILKLDNDQRVLEIARMLGGQTLTNATKTAAQEMIDTAQD